MREPKRCSVKRWTKTALQATQISCGCCSGHSDLIGIDLIAQDGNTFAHAHFDVETARLLRGSLLAAIEEIEGPL